MDTASNPRARALPFPSGRACARRGRTAALLATCWLSFALVACSDDDNNTGTGSGVTTNPGTAPATGTPDANPTTPGTGTGTPGANPTTPGANPSVPAVGQPPAPATANAEMQAILDAHAALGAQPVENLSVEQARAQPSFADAVTRLLQQQGRSTAVTALVPGVTAIDTQVGGAVGPLTARVYVPPGTGPFPVVVYFHGGGWVTASRVVYDAGARGLAAQAGAMVISVDYRLAPENRFPAAHDDALAAYRWIAENVAQWNGDPARLALAGESAGGNLALATAIAARDAQLPAPRHVVAVYPVAQNRLDTPSYQQYAQAKPLSRAAIQWFVDRTVRTPDDLNDPRLNLVGANLTGLAPVTIINAEIDPLRDDGALLEQALTRAGVSVERRNYAGVTHEFFGAAAVLAEARDAQSYAGQRLREAFATQSAAGG